MMPSGIVKTTGQHKRQPITKERQSTTKRNGNDKRQERKRPPEKKHIFRVCISNFIWYSSNFVWCCVVTLCIHTITIPSTNIYHCCYKGECQIESKLSNNSRTVSSILSNCEIDGIAQTKLKWCNFAIPLAIALFRFICHNQIHHCVSFCAMQCTHAAVRFVNCLITMFEMKFLFYNLPPSANKLRKFVAAHTHTHTIVERFTIHRIDCFKYISMRSLQMNRENFN